MIKVDSELEPDLPVLTRSQVRRVDQIAIGQYGIPGIVLMENAGRGCVEQIIKRGCQGPVAICCGPGNNGGDGFVIARHLNNRGIEVKILLAGESGKYCGDAGTNLNIIQKMGLSITCLPELSFAHWQNELEFVQTRPTEWLVDALLGTGATGPLRPPIDELVKIMNRIPACMMAVDLPTGMDCDTGYCQDPTIRADVTYTFVARKPAFAMNATIAQHGEIEVIDIGVPPMVIRQAVGQQD